MDLTVVVVAPVVVGVVLALGLLLVLCMRRRTLRRSYEAPRQQETDSEVGDLQNSPGPAAAPPRAVEQHVYLMRHGEREDDLNPAWTDSAERPFDPPLTIAGREAALAAGRVLRSADIGVVVTSPFLRCVETAVYVSEGLGYRQEILLDYGLSEVHNTDVIKGADPLQPVVLSPTDLAAHFRGKAFIALAQGSPPMPLWGEQRGIGGSAHVRFVTALARVAEQYSPANVLLISHGDAVAACVGNLLPPGAMVYRTDYCCCAHFVRGKVEWELRTEPGAGIEWIAD